MKKWISKHELAQLLGINRKTLYRWLHQNAHRIPHYNERQRLLDPEQTAAVKDILVINDEDLE